MREAPKGQKIVLLHGIFMTGAMLYPLRQRLRAQGFNCQTFTYASIRRSPSENASALIGKIRAFAAGEPVYFIGHSLGGLVLRHLQQQAPELFQNSKVITLASPHHGSQVAEKLRHIPLCHLLLKNAWHRGLDGNAPDWTTQAPLLNVIGTKNSGIGRWLRIFPRDEACDGTVALEEAQFNRACHCKRLESSHTLMLYQNQTVDLIKDWFQRNN